MTKTPERPQEPNPFDREFEYRAVPASDELRVLGIRDVICIRPGRTLPSGQLVPEDGTLAVRAFQDEAGALHPEIAVLDASGETLAGFELFPQPDGSFKVATITGAAEEDLAQLDRRQSSFLRNLVVRSIDAGPAPRQ